MIASSRDLLASNLFRRTVPWLKCEAKSPCDVRLQLPSAEDRSRSSHCWTDVIEWKMVELLNTRILGDYAFELLASLTIGMAIKPAAKSCPNNGISLPLPLGPS